MLQERRTTAMYTESKHLSVECDSCGKKKISFQPLTSHEATKLPEGWFSLTYNSFSPIEYTTWQFCSNMCAATWFQGRGD